MPREPSRRNDCLHRVLKDKWEAARRQEEGAAWTMSMDKRGQSADRASERPGWGASIGAEVGGTEAEIGALRVMVESLGALGCSVEFEEGNMVRYVFQKHLFGYTVEMS